MVAETRDREGLSARVDAIKAYVRKHVDEPLNREILAEIAGFSVSHFHRVFVDNTGESIANYVRRIRLERAGRKLRMGAVDITEVALAAGYGTQAAFGKAFKKRFGFSPTEFRQLSCRAATQILVKG